MTMRLAGSPATTPGAAPQVINERGRQLRRHYPAALDFYGLLDFVGQSVEVLVQLVIHRALDPVRCQVPDQGGLSRFPAKFFN
jgi:hypothetical protein